MLSKLSYSLVALSMILVAQANAKPKPVTLELEIPRMQVAEYHRPYVAAWLRESSSKKVTNLALWYQIDEDGEGEKWLKDLRQWWRRSGRSLDMPADGFTGATRPPGLHTVDVSDQLSGLAKGEYTLYVEASREVGGREILSIPFSWPAVGSETLTAQGESELGKITFIVQP